MCSLLLASVEGILIKLKSWWCSCTTLAKPFLPPTRFEKWERVFLALGLSPSIASQLLASRKVPGFDNYELVSEGFFFQVTTQAAHLFTFFFGCFSLFAPHFCFVTSRCVWSPLSFDCKTFKSTFHWPHFFRNNVIAVFIFHTSVLHQQFHDEKGNHGLFLKIAFFDSQLKF